VVVGLAAVAVGIANAAAPARLFVNAKEFSLVTSRQTVKPGTALIQLYNGGEDAHDLRLQRVGGTRALRVRETSPGDVTELQVMLRAGKWKLWCSLPGHAKAGMRATVVVRP
jgi:plastocyanin